MLNLETTDKLQLVTSAAVTVDVFAAYADLSGTTVTPAAKQTLISTATTSDIVLAPGAGVRNVQSLFIRNRSAATPVDVTVIHDRSGTDAQLHSATLNGGETLEYSEGLGFYALKNVTSGDLLMRILDADVTGQNATTAQPWFPTAGAVTVEAGVTYEINGILYTVRSAGTTSHGTSVLFAGTATVSNIAYHAVVNSGDVDTTSTATRTAIFVATAVSVKAASTSATEATSIKLDGMVRFSAAGTFIPQFQYTTAAPGGAPTIRRNSHFRLDKRGSSAMTSIGTWT